MYISALDHAQKLKLSKFVQLPSINKMFQYIYTWVILCNEGEFYMFTAKVFMIGVVCQYLSFETL